jgi:hypothetical protein
MRSPRISICAPIGVARFFRRAMCPSKASSAIAVTVSPTAARFAQGPRPNKPTAANPTATRSAVTLFGVHCIATCPKLPAPYKSPLVTWQPPCQPPHAQSLRFPSLTSFLADLHVAARPPNTSSVARFLPYISNAARARLIESCNLASANRGASPTYAWGAKIPAAKKRGSLLWENKRVRLAVYKVRYFARATNASLLRASLRIEIE